MIQKYLNIKKVDLKGRLAGEILLLALFLGILVASRVLTPSESGMGTHTKLGLPPCTFYRITGLPCPGCGLTTCFTHMARFHFRKAFLVHPFGPLLFGALLLLLIYQCILVFARYEVTLKISVRAETILFIVLFTLFLLFSIVRAIYCYYHGGCHPS